MKKSARILPVVSLVLLGQLTASAAAQTTQTITFDAIPNRIFGIQPFVIAAQASSLLPVTFASTTPTVCTTSDDLVILLTAGTCSITASQPGNTTYSPATPVTQSFTVSVAKASGSFVAAPNSPFAVGTNPFSVVVGDFNGDGIPDFATANQGSINVTVLLGNGSGGFTPAQGSPFAAGTQPFSLAVGDFNGDGIQDLAAANQGTNNITVLLGNGSGGFTQATGSPFAVGNEPFAVVVGDFNGDGIQDLAVANYGDGTVTVLLGNGSAGFSQATGSPYTVGTNPFSVAVGDFNGDGNQDLAVANAGDGTVSVLLGNGSGGFNPSTGSPFTVGSNPYFVGVGEFTGSGVQDLVTANAGSNNVTVLIGNGLGGFTQATGSPFAVGTNPDTVAVADCNGDGIPDLAVANYVDNTVTVLLGNGSGGFAPAAYSPLPAGNGSPFVVAADFNKDGMEDLAVGDFKGNAVTVLLGAGAGATSQTITFGPLANVAYGVSPFAISASASSGLAVSLASLTSGVCTVAGSTVTIAGGGTCTILASQLGNATYAPAVSVTQSFTVNPASQTIAFGTLSGVNLAASMFSIAATASSGLTVSFASTTAAVCTVSGNVVTILATGTCSITATQPGNNNYAAANPVTQSFTVTPEPQTIAFDAILPQILGVSPFVIAAQASSLLPVAFASTTPAVCKTSDDLVMLLTAGTCSITASQPGNAVYVTAAPVTQSFTVSVANLSGSFTPSTGSPFPVGAAPFSVAVADFNRDGIRDFAVTNYSTGNVTVLLGNGSDGFSAAPGSPFAVGSNPLSVAVGDFNGDGIPDLVTANAGSNTVTVLLGNGLGGFTPAPGSPFTVGTNPGSVVVGDFNGDGILDLATSNQSNNSVTVLLGNGSGGFTASSASPVALGTAGTAGSLAIGDFNGDGKLDLAASLGQVGIAVLLGNGSGGFTASTGSPFAAGQAGASVVVGDFNGDGIQDLATASLLGSVAVFLGNGSGRFTAAPNSPFTVGSGPFSLVVGDFNGDGIQDLATANYVSNNVTVLLGKGTGAFTQATGSPLAAGSGPSWITAADFNGDGIEDLAVANATSNNVTVLLGVVVGNTTQTITFPAPGSVTYGVAPFTIGATASSGLPVSFASTTSGVCTISGKMVTIVGGGTCSVVASQPGNATYAAAATVMESFAVNPISQAITFGALSNVSLGVSPFTIGATASSGLAVTFASNTLAVCTVSGTTVTILGGGTCSITASQSGNASYTAAATVTQIFTVLAESQTISFDVIPPRIYGISPFVIAAKASSGLPVVFASATPTVCKNSDDLVMLLKAGTCSIAASQAGNASYSAATPVTRSFTVSVANPSGSFMPATGSPLAAGTQPFSIATGDFNGDGIPDFAAANAGSNNVSVFLGNGSGGFTAATGSPFAVGTNPLSVTVGDFNGDGSQDLAVGNYADSTVTVLLGNGAGGFTPAAGSPFAAGTQPVSVAVGDFNGDGIQDLAVANLGSGNVTVLLGSGTGAFTPAQNSPFAAGTQPFSVAVGDFNRDGIEDLAVANDGSNNVTVLLGNGSGGFTAAPGSPFAVGDEPGSIAVGDFNRDGIQDLAVPNQEGNNVTVLLGNGSGGFTQSSGSPFQVGNYPDSAVVGDFNGDGIPDLAVANYYDNTVTVLIGNGSGAFTPSIGSPWQVGVNPYWVAAVDLTGGGIEDLITANYGSNNITVLLGTVVGSTPQTIAFGPLSSVNYGVSPVTIGATSSSGLAVSFASPTSSICTVTGNTVTIVAAGACSIFASQAGNATYAAAATVLQILTVNPEPQTIAFGALSGVTVGVAPFTVAATASSGLAVSFASNTAAVCTVSGTTVTILAAGTCSITASQAGSANYAAATSVTQTFAVATGPQTISFDPIPTRIYGVSPFVIAAQASSLLPVAFTSTTPAVCKNSDDLVILLSAGTCSIKATQAGNASYTAATPATQSFLVKAANPSYSLAAAPGSPFAAGSQPISIAIGDFNGDGIPDFAAADAGGNSVTVMLGTGSGGFSAATGSPFAVGNNPLSVAVGDFNGDGIQDLAVPDYEDGTVTVLLGNGSGGFAPAAGSPFTVGTNPFGVAVGDFNQDGIQDLAVTNAGGNNVTVLLGTGSGGFTAASGSPLAAGTFPQIVVVGDFNGDGIPDLAIANEGSNNLTVLLGNGTGGFTPATGSPFAAGTESFSLAVGDFNRDGIQDLAIANEASNSVTVLLGSGTGGFTPSAGSPFAVGTNPTSVMVGDFNGDGIPDLAVANYTDNTVTVLLGNGAGGFAASAGSPFAVGTNPFGLAAADFTADGIEDLAVANYGAGSVTVLLGLATGATAQTITFASPGALIYGIAPLTLTATASSGLTVSFVSATPAVCTVAGNTLTLVAVGACTITASQGGSATYAPAPIVTRTFTVGQGTQTITFGPLSAITLPASSFTLTATSSSGLAVSFASTTTGVCTVSGSALTPLAAGTCSVTASQTGNANYQAAAPVTQSFTINPAASSGGGGGGGGGGSAPPAGNPLTVSPASVTIGAAFGGASGTQTVTLNYQTQTQGAPSFSSNFSTNQGLGWLSVTPASGTMTQASYAGFIYTYTATVTINANPAGIAAGSSYTGTVNFSSGSGIVSVPVTMNVTSQPAKFTLAPQSLSFSYQQGSAILPAAQGVSVFSVPAGGSFSAIAFSTGNWLSVATGNSSTLTTPGVVTVSVNVTGLSPGSYSGLVTVSAGTLTTIEVPVTLKIQAAAAAVALSVSPGIYTIPEVQGAASSGGMVTVSNSGGGTLQFTAAATSDLGWLSLGGAASGSATPASPASLPFTVNPSNLNAGTYNGSITVSGVNSSMQATVKVVLALAAPEPVIQLSNSGFALTAVAAGAAPQSQTFTVSNAGTDTLNWSAQASTLTGGNWLSATPGSGTLASGQSGTVSISANTTGLAAGQYYGSVNLVAPNAANSPQTVSVVLNVLSSAPSPAVTLSTNGLLLSGASGTTAQQNIGLFNLSSTALSYSESTFTQSGTAWLSVNPSAGSATPGASSVQIAANLSGLSGVQSGTVTLGFVDGTTAAIQVVAVVTGSAASNVRTEHTAAYHPLAANHPAPQTSVTACPGSKASFLIPVFREPASQSSQQVAAATTVQAQVMDDCGHAVTAATGGSVQVTFSNGDPGINLNDVGSGIWEATWVPQNASSSVVLQVTASENGLTANSSLGALSGVTVSVAAAGTNAAPQPTGIANAASAAQATPGVVAPGSYVAIYGTGLAGTGSPSATSLPLPTTLNGAQLFLGGLPMPLLYAGAGQVNALVPQAIAPNATYPLVVVRGTTQSVPVALTVTELQPGTYTVNTSGSGAGIVTNALTGVLNRASNPAHAGDYLSIYCTGLGALTGAGGQTEPGDGVAAPSNIVYSTTSTVTATIGGVKAPALFSGLTPTFAALYQVNVQVPAGVAAGNAVPVVLTATDPATGATAVGNAVAIVVQ